jgi:cysteine-rich repeat protein
MVAVAALSGCHAVTGLDGFDVADVPLTVGNCARDAGETCDDCNALGGDGCDLSGQLEPGWVCDPSDKLGDVCRRVTGFTAAQVLPPIEVGGGGGGDFSRPCAETELLIGLRGRLSMDGALTRVRGVCSEIAVSEDGALVWRDGEEHPTAAQGTNEGELLDPALCPLGMVAVGLGGFTTTAGVTVVAGVVLSCAEVRFAAGAFASGPPTELQVFGESTAGATAVAACAPDEVFAELAGASGSLLDRLAMPCHKLSPTLCGDGVTSAFEECDGGAACGPDCKLK